jgi:hypothetical protein
MPHFGVPRVECDPSQFRVLHTERRFLYLFFYLAGNLRFFIAAVVGLWLWIAVWIVAIDVVCVMFGLGLMVCVVTVRNFPHNTWSSCLAHEITKLMVW